MPEDVAVTSNSKLAVVRGYTDAANPAAKDDEIVVVKLTNGTQSFFPIGSCTNHGLTRPQGNSDLDQATRDRAILIGERNVAIPAAEHKTCIDIIDLSGAIGAVPTCLLNWEKDGAGDVDDVAITPNNRLAVVSASGVIALYDLTQSTPALVDEFLQSGIQRDYDFQSDSLEVTNTQAVVAGREGPVGPNWQVNVLDLGPSALTNKLTLSLTTVSSIHDLTIDADSNTAVLRATGAAPAQNQVGEIVVLKGLDQGTVGVTRLTSETTILQRQNGEIDSVVLSPQWYVPVQSGSGLRQYAVSFANLGGPAHLVVVDVADNPPTIALDQVLDTNQTTYHDVNGSSLRLIAQGRAVALRCRAAPYDPSTVPANYDKSLGEDVWVFSLDPIQEKFHYEAWGYLPPASDSLEVSRFRAVSISEHFTSSMGWVHTIGFN